jgi:drug/metabolite transporter (DMT)-like permease
MYKLIPYFIVTVAPLCWAGDIVLGRGLADKIPPFSLVFWRWTIAFLFLLPFAWKSLIKDWPKIKSSWGTLSLFSLLGISGFITLLYVGLHTTTAINSALIQTTLPAIIVLLCLFLYGEKISKIQIAGIALCILGACYVVFQGDWHHAKKIALVRGDLLILIAAVIYGLYSALLPKSPNVHPFSFLACISFLGALTMLPFYIWEIFKVGTMPITQQTVLGIAYVAIFPSIVAYMCWNKGVSLIGANKTGVFICLIPIFTAMLSTPFLKEPLKMYHLIGMMLIFCGMILFNRNKTEEDLSIHA